jgi:hypothetical protein
MCAAGASVGADGMGEVAPQPVKTNPRFRCVGHSPGQMGIHGIWFLRSQESEQGALILGHAVGKTGQAIGGQGMDQPEGALILKITVIAPYHLTKGGQRLHQLVFPLLLGQAGSHQPETESTYHVAAQAQVHWSCLAAQYAWILPDGFHPLGEPPFANMETLVLGVRHQTLSPYTLRLLATRHPVEPK